METHPRLLRRQLNA
jgi:hypothetical protein